MAHTVKASVHFLPYTVFPGGSDGKSICLQCRRPRLGRSPGEGNGSPLQYSCLENPIDCRAWKATVHGVAKSRTRLSDFITIHKDNSNGIKDLNVRPETIKILEENIGRMLNDINQSKILYDPPPRVMEIKANVNNWDLIKLKSFCTAKETISKVERQPSKWGKIIANETTEKGLISKIYKQLIQLNTRKTNTLTKKWQKYQNRYFSKEDIQMVNKHMTRCSIFGTCTFIL